MGDSKDSTPRVVTFAAAGLELAGLAVVFAAFGYGIDRWLENTKPFGTGLAGLVGFSLGMVRFVLLANRANSSQKPSRKGN